MSLLLRSGVVCVEFGYKELNLQVLNSLTYQFHYPLHKKWVLSAIGCFLYISWEHATLKLLARCHSNARHNPSTSAKRNSKCCAWVLRQNATSVHIATWSNMDAELSFAKPAWATFSALLLCERGKCTERQRLNWLWQRKDFAESVRKFTAGWRPLKKEKRVCLQLGCTSLHSVTL